MWLHCTATNTHMHSYVIRDGQSLPTARHTSSMGTKCHRIPPSSRSLKNVPCLCSTSNQQRPSLMLHHVLHGRCSGKCNGRILGGWSTEMHQPTQEGLWKHQHLGCALVLYNVGLHALHIGLRWVVVVIGKEWRGPGSGMQSMQ